MTHRSRKLLDVARDAPCFLELVPCWGQVVACHSDMLGDGRGVGHKSHDALAVPGCVGCHAEFTRAKLGRERYAAVHASALKRYIVWLYQNNRIAIV